MTLFKPVIMGLNTWNSLPDKVRPLPNRKNIVISTTRPSGRDSHGVVFVSSYAEALKAAHEYYSPEGGFMCWPLHGNDEWWDSDAAKKFYPERYSPHMYPDFIPNNPDREQEIMIIGGARLYNLVTEHDLVDRMYITEMAKDYEGDTVFHPDISAHRWTRKVLEVDFSTLASFIKYDRIQGG